jgi:hypothetical protein
MNIEMSGNYKQYVMMIQTLNQNLSDNDSLKTINESFNNLLKVEFDASESKVEVETATATATDANTEEETATATDTNEEETTTVTEANAEENTEDKVAKIEAAKQAFVEKCSESLKVLSSEELYSMGEKIAMMYLYIKKSGEEITEDAIERIHPIGTGSFKDVLGATEFETFMNGWQNIIDENPPSEFTMNSIKKDAEVAIEKQNKIKEESNKRFAHNIRKKVTATQAALIAKEKLEKAGMVFEEGEGVVLVKQAPRPVKNEVVTEATNEVVTEGSASDSTETLVAESSETSGGVAETKDD